MDPMEKFEALEDHIDFDCPFCGEPVRAGSNPDGEGAVLHRMPMCEQFDKLDPFEFLQAVRSRLTN